MTGQVLLSIQPWATIILKGLLIGFIAAAPTGPSGVLVISRTLDKGRLYGWMTGLGVSLSDTIYIVCSSVGLSFLVDLINNPATSSTCCLIGCALLLCFGIYTVRNNPLKKLRSPQNSRPSLTYACFSGFLVAIVNPTVIVIYISLFAYFHLTMSEFDMVHKCAGYLSVIAGDVLWWTFISFLINKIRNRFDLKGIWVINRILGTVLIAASAVWLAITLVKMFK